MTLAGFETPEEYDAVTNYVTYTLGGYLNPISFPKQTLSETNTNNQFACCQKIVYFFGALNVILWEISIFEWAKNHD